MRPPGAAQIAEPAERGVLSEPASDYPFERDSSQGKQDVPRSAWIGEVFSNGIILAMAPVQRPFAVFLALRFELCPCHEHNCRPTGTRSIEVS